MTKFRVRFAKDDPDGQFSWREFEATDWTMAGDKFAQEDCDADSENTHAWLLGGHSLVIENVETGVQVSADYVGECEINFYVTAEKPVVTLCTQKQEEEA